MLDRLLEKLRHGDGKARFEAAAALRAVQDPRKLDRIADVARDPAASDFARSDAVALIAEAGALAFPLLRAIALARGAPADARRTALAAIARLDSALDGEAVDALLRDPEPTVRGALVMDVERLAPHRVESILRAALDDASTTVRSSTRQSLPGSRPRGLGPAILSAFEKIGERLRRESLPASAAEHRLWEEEALLLGLIPYLRDPEVARAARRIATRLVEIAGDPHSCSEGPPARELGLVAADVLAQTGVEDEVVPELARVIGDDRLEGRVRDKALEALARSGGDAAQDELRQELARALDGRSHWSADVVSSALERAGRAGRAS